MFDDSHQARLFSVSGIRGEREAELRATSALLSVLSVVRPLSRRLLTPIGASRADRAVVQAFTEVSFEGPDGEKHRPDGVLHVRSGQHAFTALVEVKVGEAKLDADQINKYLRLARQEGYDCVLTISAEVAAFDGAHPTDGVQPSAGGKVQLHHLSWTRILANAIKEHAHSGVDDAEQAWLLSEFIRYLEHPNSGIIHAGDMGEHWVEVRDKARDGLLPRPTREVSDVCQRWDQLLHSNAMSLGSQLGTDVQEVVSRAHRQNPGLRTKEFAQRLCEEGVLEGRLRIPDAISDLSITADLRSARLVVSAEFAAPEEKGAKGRVGWLVRQLRDAPDDLIVESFTRGGKTPELAPLGELRTDSSLVVRGRQHPPARFRVTQRSEMGQSRRTTRKLGFADSVTESIERFYSTTLQNLRKAAPPPPKAMPRTADVSRAEGDGSSPAGPVPNSPQIVTSDADQRPIDDDLDENISMHKEDRFAGAPEGWPPPVSEVQP